MFLTECQVWLNSGYSALKVTVFWRPRSQCSESLGNIGNLHTWASQSCRCALGPPWSTPLMGRACEESDHRGFHCCRSRCFQLLVASCERAVQTYEVKQSSDLWSNQHRWHKCSVRDADAVTGMYILVKLMGRCKSCDTMLMLLHVESRFAWAKTGTCS